MITRFGEESLFSCACIPAKHTCSIVGVNETSSDLARMLNAKPLVFLKDRTNYLFKYIQKISIL